MFEKLMNNLLTLAHTGRDAAFHSIQKSAEHKVREITSINDTLLKLDIVH